MLQGMAVLRLLRGFLGWDGFRDGLKVYYTLLLDFNILSWWTRVIDQLNHLLISLCVTCCYVVSSNVMLFTNHWTAGITHETSQVLQQPVFFATRLVFYTLSVGWITNLSKFFSRVLIVLYRSLLYVAVASELRQEIPVRQRRNVAVVGDFRDGYRKPLPHRWRHGHVDTSDGISCRHRTPRDRKRVPAESDSISYQPRWPVRPNRQSLRVMTLLYTVTVSQLEAQLSQRDRTMLRLIDNFVNWLKVTQGHCKWHSK